MSLPIISYRYISSVTVSSSNRHLVNAGCLLSRYVLLRHLEPWRWDRSVIPNNGNGITTLCCVQSTKKAGFKTRSISVYLSISKMPNGPIQTCTVTLFQKITSRVNSHDIPCQRTGPGSLLNISAVVFFIDMYMSYGWGTHCNDPVTRPSD
jgi:hypothetical protein